MSVQLSTFQVHGFYAPRNGWDNLSTHHLGESLDLGGIISRGDGVKRAEGRGRCFGLEVHHVHDCTDAGVGHECLQHEVCIWVLIWVGLILDHGREKRRQVVERVALDPSPHFFDGVSGEVKGGDDAWTDCGKYDGIPECYSAHQNCCCHP